MSSAARVSSSIPAPRLPETLAVVGVLVVQAAQRAGEPETAQPGQVVLETLQLTGDLVPIGLQVDDPQRRPGPGTSHPELGQCGVQTQTRMTFSKSHRVWSPSKSTASIKGS